MREFDADLIGVALERHLCRFPDGVRYVLLLGPVAGHDMVLAKTT